MFLAVLFCVVAATAAAPERRLARNSLQLGVSGDAYGSGSPCGGGAAAHLLPVSLYLEPEHAASHYREFHDKESARSAYGYGGSSYSGAGAGAALGGESAGGAAGSGAAYGVFPGSTGPCATPLLLSCSPKVIHGQIVHNSYSAPATYGASGSLGATYSAPAYKEVADEKKDKKSWNLVESNISHESKI